MSVLGLLASSGSDEPLYSSDVFSAYTYTGNSSTQTITNGIDLAGKGGLVWCKSRTNAYDNSLYDTARGVNKELYSNTTGASYPGTGTLTGFNSDGFTLGANSSANGGDCISWTFRKATKFFDIVTWTGDGTSNRAISHSLGCEVGMVITKITSTTGDWNTYHRSATGDLVLNTTAVQAGSRAIITAATDSTFTVTGVANTNAATYVAYLFAHDTAADGIIQCGSLTTDGSGNATVNLGWESQYVLIKAVNNNQGWVTFDTSRGFRESPATDMFLHPDSSATETSSFDMAKPTATGFALNSAVTWYLNANYIYLAIRRPNKPPTTGTQVYNAIARTGTGATATVTGVGFAPDLNIGKERGSTGAPNFTDRLRGATYEILSSGATAEATFANDLTAFTMDGMNLGSGASGQKNTNTSTYIEYFLRRAVGVFDEVCDTGTGSAHTISHNLGVVPELIIRKGRSGATQWEVYCSQLANTEKLVLNSTAAKATDTTAWNSTTPTSSVFTVGTGANVNTNTATYVSYLFATNTGISKVGSFTGNGSNQTINCGFTTGARFILIKRTDSTGDWYVWDSVRGIVAGNDPHLSLNTTAAEVTSDDSIDPDNSGFIVNQLAATNINVNAATYIYLAFA